MASALGPPFFCFTLDTEPDDLWANRPALGFTHFSRLLVFHRELAARGARPTYLTTSEVAEDGPSARVLHQILETGQAEIGAHFHTWTRSWPFPLPDLGRPPRPRQCSSARPGRRGADLEHTCTVLKCELGTRPVSYSSGRWSFNGGSVRSLRNCGIRIDRTMTPGLTWESPEHPLLSGPDFRRAPRQPHWLAVDSLEARAEGDVLELPVAASFHPDAETALSQSFAAKLAGGCAKRWECRRERCGCGQRP